MSSQTVHSSFSTDRDRLRKVLLATGIVSALIATGFTAIGVFYRGPEHHHTHSPWEFYFVAAVVVIATAVVFGFLLPRGLRKESAGGTALTLSSIALLVLLPAFWSGLPLVLGVGGAMLGYAGKNAVSGSGKSTVAVVLGLLAAVGYVAIYILDTVDRAGIF